MTSPDEVVEPQLITQRPKKKVRLLLLGWLGATAMMAFAAWLPNGAASHICEAIGAALIGACVAVPLIELRGHDRLMNDIAAVLQQQHDHLAVINNRQHAELARITEQHQTQLASMMQEMLDGLTSRADIHIDNLLKIVSTKSDEALPTALEQLFTGTSPDAKLHSRTSNITTAVKTLKQNRSWRDDVSLRFIGELLYYASENAISLASARTGGAYPIILPPSSSWLADKILATQMRLMTSGDEYVVLSDLSSWKYGLTAFYEATKDAVAHGVRVRRLICPFDHDDDMSEEAVRAVFLSHWNLSSESLKDNEGRPFYELGVVRRNAVKRRQLHHIGIFRRNDEGVKFEPYEPDLSEMRFARTTEHEPVNMAELWPHALLTYRRTTTGGFESISADEAWVALGTNWWKQTSL